ncbi:MAG: tRNA epoxyqueuosine(34) reductase QueG, partial [Candidatus Rokubacteria bacterium]|nr:tRNA epoxyqueuosine(34) reductase QueG [Candidatus Rokubacteria bacterium]
MTPADLARRVKTEARRLGFELVAVGPADPPEHGAAFGAWLEAGYAGEMAYLERSRAKRLDPREVLPGARSVIACAMNYHQGEAGDGPTHVSRYAWGRDYHAVLEPRLRALLAFLQAERPGTEGRVYVDTGPVLERDLAARAGLGWFGKNTCILNRQHGSYFFLGALLLNVELPPDGATTAHCGSCTRCLDVCPTGAFLGSYVMDARRCISYLTIELRGPIPRELRSLVGNWIFGCDLCQEVCPWNRKSARTSESRFTPRTNLQAPELIPLLELTPEGYRL